MNRAVLVLAAGLWLATPAWADPFFFSTGTPDGLLGALSQTADGGHLETETADDFNLSGTATISQATVVGLIPSGTPLASISNVEVEVYHVFPKDSGDPQPGHVPSRVNSPGDVEIDAATRDSSSGTLAFNASVMAGNFSVLNSVADDINAAPTNVTNGEGPASGEVIQITITFTPPIVLPADHYFFRPEVRVSGGDFLFLSAPKPIVAPGTPFLGDLQAWVRNSELKPDWLRIGTDIIGGTPPPTFNMAFSLTGEIAPVAETPTPTGTPTPTPTARSTATTTATAPPMNNGGGCSIGAAPSTKGASLWFLLAPIAVLLWARRRRSAGATMKRSTLTALLSAGLVMGVAGRAAAGFPTFAVRKCAADAVVAGTVCLDRYEASVWRIPHSIATNALVVAKIHQGRATEADLTAAGAVQLGTKGDDYERCGDDGRGCTDEIYAVSLPSEIPSANITWFQAQEACANSGKRLPTNAEWQVGANGTPDPGPDNGTTDCNTGHDGAVTLTGGRSSCVSVRGAFDMVGNLAEWVADWAPLSTACPGWGGFSDDFMCLSGASETGTGPGALVRGGGFFGGSTAGPLTVFASFEPSRSQDFVGFRCAR